MSFILRYWRRIDFLASVHAMDDSTRKVSRGLKSAAHRGMIPTVQSAYELFDHTADMGIRARAATQVELLQPAADGLYAAIGELVSAGGSEAVRFELRAADRATLLRDFLNELLILFERERRMLVAIDSVDFSESCLTVAARSSPVDAERSVYHHEVKAITYHELSIRPIDGGFEATLIVDI